MENQRKSVRPPLLARARVELSESCKKQFCLSGLLRRFAMAVCYGDLLWRFAMAICHGGLLWRFAMAVCYGDLPRRFAMALCYGNLLYLNFRFNILQTSKAKRFCFCTTANNLISGFQKQRLSGIIYAF